MENEGRISKRTGGNGSALIEVSSWPLAEGADENNEINQ
jgi:hypothetical protein